jgi:hypothetical protein
MARQKISGKAKQKPPAYRYHLAPPPTIVRIKDRELLLLIVHYKDAEYGAHLDLANNRIVISEMCTASRLAKLLERVWCGELGLPVPDINAPYGMREGAQ